MPRAAPIRPDPVKSTVSPPSRGMPVTGLCFASLMVGAVLGGVAGRAWRGTEVHQSEQAQTYPTVAQMMAMTDAELERVDPIVMNLVVAKGIPECAGLNIAKYAETVDEWATAIREKNARDERNGVGAPLLKQDRKLWMAGGMAVMLAGTYGIKYTTEHLDSSKPEPPVRDPGRNRYLDGVSRHGLRRH